MDFNASRGSRQPQSTTNPSGAPRPTTSGSSENFLSSDSKPKSSKPSKPTGILNLKFASVALLFSATILVVALLAYLAMGSARGEDRFVEDDKYQAVFLNGGQVYFGKVTDLNNKYFRVVDIYYLRVNQQVQPAEDGSEQAPSDNDISLVKLGCELHGPKDEMLINRQQVIFWENLKDDGQVAEAITAYKAENPDGQDCEVPDQAGSPTQPVVAPTPETEDDN